MITNSLRQATSADTQQLQRLFRSRVPLAVRRLLAGGVIMLEYINQRWARGVSIADAAVEGVLRANVAP